MDRLRTLVLEAHDRMIGLTLRDLAVERCMAPAPCGGEMAGRSPVNRDKQGLKRSLVVEATGIPLVIAAPASRPDSPLPEATLDTLDRLGLLPAAVTVHLDRGSDAAAANEPGAAGRDCPEWTARCLVVGQRWVAQRTHARFNGSKTLVWCTERRAVVVAFWKALAAVIIVVRRQQREGRIRGGWDARPTLQR